MMNKKAYYNMDDMIILFACFLIIGLGIVLGIWMFYSVGIDVRVEESKTMANKLVGAVAETGFLDANVLNADFNILKEAGIDEKAISSGNYYFYVKIIEDGNEIKSFAGGTKEFEVQCGLPGEQMAKCYEKALTVLDRGKECQIKVLAGSSQLGSKL